MGVLSVIPQGDGVWQFHEEASDGPVDAYLVCGEKEGILIDALQDAHGVYQKARELTSLPLRLVITHAHLDHLGPAVEEFYQAGCEVCLSRADFPLLGRMGSRAYPHEYFQDLTAGRVFSLGGRELEVIPLPGHTPGSVALLDRKTRLLFSGDGIGSGPIWMQLPFSLSLAELERSLTKLLHVVEGWPELLIFPGHRHQSPGPLGLEYIKDVLETAKLIRSGCLRGEPQLMVFHEDTELPYATVRHKSMLGFSYDPSRLG